MVAFGRLLFRCRCSGMPIMNSQKRKDAMIIAANPAHKKLIAAILDNEGHDAFVCDNIKQCEAMLKFDPRINIVLGPAYPRNTPVLV